jgi:hypothetical protein
MKRFHNKPQYTSEFFDEINRKVLFREPLILENLNYSSVTGSSENKEDILELLEKIFATNELKIRLFNTIYNQSKNQGIACLIIRKLLNSDKITMKEIYEYYESLCSRFNIDPKTNQSCNSICFKSDARIIRDLENILPSDFEPKKILCLGCSGVVIEQLQNKFEDCKVEALIDHKSKYDLIIVSCYLHHQDDHSSINTLKQKLNEKGCIFIREIDAENDTDILLTNKMHDFNNILCSGHINSSNIDYIPRETLVQLFKPLHMYAESQFNYDPMHNPTKLYSMLFTTSVDF